MLFALAATAPAISGYSAGVPESLNEPISHIIVGELKYHNNRYYCKQLQRKHTSYLRGSVGVDLLTKFLCVEVFGE